MNTTEKYPKQNHANLIHKYQDSIVRVSFENNGADYEGCKAWGVRSFWERGEVVLANRPLGCGFVYGSKVEGPSFRNRVHKLEEEYFLDFPFLFVSGVNAVEETTFKNTLTVFEYIPIEEIEEDILPLPPYVFYAPVSGEVYFNEDYRKILHSIKVSEVSIDLGGSLAKKLVENGQSVKRATPLCLYFTGDGFEKWKLENEESSMQEKIDALKLNEANLHNSIETTKAELSELSSTKLSVLRSLFDKEGTTILEKAEIEADNIINSAKDRADFEAGETIKKAESEAEKILQDAHTHAQESNRTQDEQSQNYLKEIERKLDQPDLGFYVKPFLNRLSEVDDMAINDQEALTRLHVAITKSLEQAQGVAPENSEAVSAAMLVGHQIDVVSRFYSAKIKAVKSNDDLDEGIKEIQIRSLQETLETQLLAISKSEQADI